MCELKKLNRQCEVAVMNELTANQKAFIKAFNADSQIIGEQTEKFLKLVYPSYLIDKTDLELLLCVHKIIV